LVKKQDNNISVHDRFQKKKFPEQFSTEDISQTPIGFPQVFFYTELNNLYCWTIGPISAAITLLVSTDRVTNFTLEAVSVISPINTIVPQ
jgi:hypothetical protein